MMTDDNTCTLHLYDDIIQEENVALENANLAMMAYFS